MKTALLEFISKLFRRSTERSGEQKIRVAFDEDFLRVFGLADDGRTIELKWAEMRSIVAFKRDLLTVDSMRIGIETDAGRLYEIGEEADGWFEMVESLPRYLPGAKSVGAWYEQVMLPAFETNLTTIYTRSG